MKTPIVGRGHVSYDITVGDGKYRILWDDDGFRALRYGKEWRDLTGDSLVLVLVQEVEALRKQIRKEN